MKKVFIRSIKFLAVILIIFMATIKFNEMRFNSKQIKATSAPVVQITDVSDVLHHLSDAIQIKTISNVTSDTTALKKFNNFLEKTFPLVNSKLEKITVNNFSLVYTWRGSDSTLKPNSLMAHMDVVPAEGVWVVPPFDGMLRDGYIWGRGALDNKNAVMAILESVEHLLRNNFQPKRTIILCFGHDEEIGGKEGAKKIVSYLASKNIQANMVIDEGSIIANGIIPGIKKPVALIGIAEKGYASFKLSIDSLDGGHSSMPGKETAIGILSQAVIKLQNNQMTAKISEPVNQFLNYIGPEMPSLEKTIIANRWLFERGIIKSYEKQNSGNALMRTTIVPTIINSGVKDNVLPQEGYVILNSRIIPGEQIEDVMNHIKKVIDDPRIIVTIEGNAWNPSPISKINNVAYKTLEKTVKQIFPDVIITPSLTVASTDSRYFSEICKNVYRFNPIIFYKSDLERLHGNNEKISVESYKDMIRFYTKIIDE